MTFVHDEVSVIVFYDKDGSEDSKFESCNVDIFCVQSPVISGVSSIQECCTDIVKFCDDSNGTQDTWTWSVSGGSIISGQGTSCIDVIPNNTGNLTISSVAGRTTGLTAYTRTGTKSVTRFQPNTSDINGPSFVCDGESIELCVESLCGMSSVNWNVPSTFSILGGQGTNCIQISSNSPDGTTANITTQAQFSGGCTATVSTHGIAVYSSEEPPCLDGYPIIIFEDGYNPCDHDGTSYTFDFITSNPYLNGITTITPGIVIDVPHHHVGDRIRVTVCNINLCSGKRCCKTYLLYLPAPCEKDDPIKPLVSNGNGNQSEQVQIGFSTVGDDGGDDLSNTYIDIFPNPTQNKFILKSTTALTGQLTIRNIYGNIVAKKMLDNLVKLDIFGQYQG